MWKFLANKILRNRIAFIVVLLLLTVFMAYKALNIKLSYEFVRVLPTTDPAYVEYENFKQKFGEDGSVMVIGFADSTIFQIEKFNSWFLLSDKIRKMDGIQNVLSIGDLYDVVRNDSLHKFDFVPLVKSLPQRQSEIDSIKNRIDELPFYDGLILNRETHATVMAITFRKKDLDSKHRIDIVNEIKKEADAFGRLHNIELHYSGMPYIRTAVMEKVSHELKLFLLLAVLITAFILWVFFRTISSVVFSILVVAIGVVWSMGSIELFNFKITILTALIPPLIMVIGVPNCIFLINKYHSEYARH
ncbi:MAG TPA: MMPL family transporter, partial [Bacteroidia bacterium]|nr:MMPL family transporter [Bacteroidia bacterium]